MNEKNYEYSAFISYKHNPDEKIAKYIQYQIEHYIVPKQYRGSSIVSGKYFKRVFRDSTELSGHHDLTMAIQNALSSSEFLIVILSTDTIKSPWVPREIELFLENHSRDHIITVISDGDKSSRFYPELLIEKDKEGIIKNPLSVDYRVWNKEKSFLKKKTVEHHLFINEFPRIAAPMLGVNYDDLKQRLVKDRKKKMWSIIGLVASIFIISFFYVFWSLIQIDKNYKKSLENQSKIYAKNSQIYLEDDNRLEAIKLAMQALPNEENKDIPIIPEAHRALSQAVGAYIIPSSKHEEAIKKISMSNGISDFVVDNEGRYILCYDAANNILLKDIELDKTIIDTSVYQYGKIVDIKYL